MLELGAAFSIKNEAELFSAVEHLLNDSDAYSAVTQQAGDYVRRVPALHALSCENWRKRFPENDF